MLRVREVATELAVTEKTVRAWISAGRIGHVKFSRRAIRVPQEALDRFIQKAKANDGKQGGAGAD